MHEYHIIFVLTGENGVEISACFEALGANFDSHCVMLLRRSNRVHSLGLYQLTNETSESFSSWRAAAH